MHQLFQSVLWPAVAGNVIWAFVTVAIQDLASPGAQSVAQRLVLLAVVGVYLCVEWMRAQKMVSAGTSLRTAHWVADAFLASSISALAIAAQAETGDGKWFLLGVLAAAAIAHATDAWVPQGETRTRSKRLYWVMLNAVAAAIAVGGGEFFADWGWHLPIAMTLVVVCWALARLTAIEWFARFRDGEKTIAPGGG